MDVSLLLFAGGRSPLQLVSTIQYPVAHGQRFRPVSTEGIDTDAHVWDGSYCAYCAGSHPSSSGPSAPPTVAGGDGDEFLRILWHAVVPPNHMHVRAQQQEVALVYPAHRLLGKIEHRQGHASRLECRPQWVGVVFRIQAQQRVTVFRNQILY